MSIGKTIRDAAGRILGSIYKNDFTGSEEYRSTSGFISGTANEFGTHSRDGKNLSPQRLPDVFADFRKLVNNDKEE